MAAGAPIIVDTANPAPTAANSEVMVRDLGACPELRGIWVTIPWWSLGGATDAFGVGVGVSLEGGDELGHLLVALDAAE